MEKKKLGVLAKVFICDFVGTLLESFIPRWSWLTAYWQQRVCGTRLDWPAEVSALLPP